MLKGAELISNGTAGVTWSDQGDGSLEKQLSLWIESYAAKAPLSLSFPLQLAGTHFLLKALAAMQSVPFGETISYQELAIKIGSPRAVRAAGTACNRNPFPLIIPCHRIIASHGKIGGFGGGGTDLKQRMLAFEQKTKTV